MYQTQSSFSQSQSMCLSVLNIRSKYVVALYELYYKFTFMYDTLLFNLDSDHFKNLYRG